MRISTGIECEEERETGRSESGEGKETQRGREEEVGESVMKEKKSKRGREEE